MAGDVEQLRVAVTGPTGTFGQGLIPLLEADHRVGSIVGIARRPFDPAAHGWSKMTYRQGDVRDRDALESAFAGADVVVHLAFLITGTAWEKTTRAVNVGGTLNAVHAAAAVGARRFVDASSAAAYGFHPDNPIGMDEQWPARPAAHFFYSREKAELEELLAATAQLHPDLGLYVLRPPIVLGPHALGAKDILPSALTGLAGAALHAVRSSPVRPPLALPALPMQFVHEDDVGQALMLCVLGAGPPGTYNIAGDGIVTAHDVASELGFLPLPLPLGATRRAARLLAAVPLPAAVPKVTTWAEALSHPVIIDTTKAKRDLGWRPWFSGMDALRSTVHPGPAERR